MNNRGRRGRLDEIQRIAEAFREPVEVPDFSSAILSRVDGQRGFLSSRSRALVWAGRAGIAATVTLVVLGFTLVSRVSPTALQVVALPMPVTDMITSVSDQASEQISALRTSLGPDQGAPLELTAVIASVGPLNAYSQPIGAAVQAVRFVGPPDTGSPSIAAAELSRTSVGSSSLARFSALSRSAWPPVGLRETMGDREWLDEDSPLLLGGDAWNPAGPK